MILNEIQIFVQTRIFDWTRRNVFAVFFELLRDMVWRAHDTFSDAG